MKKKNHRHHCKVSASSSGCRMLFTRRVFEVKRSTMMSCHNSRRRRMEECHPSAALVAGPSPSYNSTPRGSGVLAAASQGGSIAMITLRWSGLEERRGWWWWQSGEWREGLSGIQQDSLGRSRDFLSFYHFNLTFSAIIASLSSLTCQTGRKKNLDGKHSDENLGPLSAIMPVL